MAANCEAYEKNQDCKFNYMLHAQTKNASKNWKDFPLPFPSKKAKQLHYGGLDQLPNHIPVKKINKNKNGNIKHH